ncbi:MAG: electron transport complex subunit RsxE [Candidatus Schekmanbacteria bacterium RBG_13_48_7]|uniref:Ion-translocating oxidoreductase complex subunit E n=1 Tax=Candidatus Schekmanbacteria bacterium RBG_13_48_7 TaxID=1817878 RepID=A0A1F7RPU8_9BACT|nr:MAG: electron transport complex subunit RsxE [Candidatus Schekmanbacteria bacterium RBG_13_48_7]
MAELTKEFTKGIYKENPIFRLALGLCPTLAVSTSVINGIGMGLAATFVLICSNIIISLIRNYIPNKVRIPCFIVVIATFVTIADLVMAGYTPDLHKALGIFIPLIVVNCIILGRAEAFARKNNVLPSVMDALGMGLGFTCTLVLLGMIREIVGSGKLFGTLILGSSYKPVILFILPPGAFLTLGLLLGIFNFLESKKK